MPLLLNTHGSIVSGTQCRVWSSGRPKHATTYAAPISNLGRSGSAELLPRFGDNRQRSFNDSADQAWRNIAANPRTVTTTLSLLLFCLSFIVCMRR